MIRAVDSFGREVFITRQQWRDSILLGTIKAQWDNPDALFSVIVSALEDGFRADVVDAARHLYEIDSRPDRGACIWGVVLMEEGRLEEAEKVLRQYLEQHGDNGSVLVNLAKVLSKRGDEAKARELLWHSLEVDPNHPNGFMWYVSTEREKGGAAAEDEAMRRVAALPGSWRAQLWLARKALEQRDLDTALSTYEEILSRVSPPMPSDLLMHISGDLGNRGHLPEIIRLVEPHFSAPVHGIQVGNNLIKAHLDLGQIDEASRLIDQLHALKRGDWAPALSFWDGELSKARVSTAPQVTPQEIELTLLTIDGPVWLKSPTPAAELFPAPSPGAPLLAFVGGSVEQPTQEVPLQPTQSDWMGRMTRALPLYLAEQTAFSTSSEVRVLVPWMIEPTESFVVLGNPIPDEYVAAQARDHETPADYVILSHLNANQSPWVAELRLVRTIDSKCLATLSTSFDSKRPQDLLPTLVPNLLQALEEHAQVSRAVSPPSYDPPSGELTGPYLFRLEQLLALRCGAMDEDLAQTFLHNEREIIQGNIQLCLTAPQSITTRILLAQSLLTLQTVRPQIPREFAEGLRLLQGQYPLPAPAQDVVQRMLDEAVSG